MSTSWVILLPLIALVVVAGAAATVVTHRAAPRRLEVIRDGGTRRRKKVVVIESQSQHELIITPQPRKGQLLALVPVDIPEAIQYEGGAHNYRLLYSLSYSLRTLSSSSSMPYIVNTSDPLTDQTDGEADRFFQNRTLATVLEKDAAATADPFILEECLKLLKADPALTEALQQHALAASPEVYRVSDLADFCAAVPLDAVTALTPPAVLYPLWLCLHRGFSVTTNRRPYLGLRLDSGLGNQLFRMAALHHLGRKLDRPVAFTGFNIKSPHSGQAYDELFAYWKYCPRDLLTTTAEPWSEPRLSYCGAEIQAYVEQRYVHTHVELKGYFQDYRYVEPGFLPHLQLPPPPLDRYPDVERAVFLHVRGGDYARVNRFGDDGVLWRRSHLRQLLVLMVGRTHEPEPSHLHARPLVHRPDVCDRGLLLSRGHTSGHSMIASVFTHGQRPHAHRFFKVRRASKSVSDRPSGYFRGSTLCCVMAFMTTWRWGLTSS